MDNPCFECSDFDDALPPPGLYSSTITNARYRSSRCGNRMLVVVHALHGVGPPNEHVADYFTLEGVSPRGLATARRRLLRLYRACGIEVAPGHQIDPADLFDAQVEIALDHESYDGELRLKVVGYRRLGRPPF